MHSNPTSAVIIEKDRRTGRLEKVRCAKCDGMVIGGGDRYLRGWIDGHFPACDPVAYVKFLTVGNQDDSDRSLSKNHARSETILDQGGEVAGLNGPVPDQPNKKVVP